MHCTRVVRQQRHLHQAVQDHLREEGHDVDTLLAEIEDVLTHARQYIRTNADAYGAVRCFQAAWVGGGGLKF